MTEGPFLREVRLALIASAEDPQADSSTRAGALMLLQEIDGGAPRLLRLLDERGDELRQVASGPGRGTLRSELVRAIGARGLRGDSGAASVLRRECLQRQEGAYATPFVTPLWRVAHMGLIATRDQRAVPALIEGMARDRIRAGLLGWLPATRAAQLLADTGIDVPPGGRSEAAVTELADRLLDDEPIEDLLDDLSRRDAAQLRGLRAILMLFLHAPKLRERALALLHGLAEPEDVGSLLQILAAEPGDAADLAHLVGACWTDDAAALVLAFCRAGEAVRWDTLPVAERVRRLLLALVAAGLSTEAVAGSVGASVGEEARAEGTDVLEGMARIRFLDRAAVSDAAPVPSLGTGRIDRWWHAPSRARALCKANPEVAGAELVRLAPDDPTAAAALDDLDRAALLPGVGESVLIELLGKHRSADCALRLGRRLALRTSHRARGLALLDRAGRLGAPTTRLQAWVLWAGGDESRAIDVLARTDSTAAHVERAAFGLPHDEPTAAWGGDARAAYGRALAPSETAAESAVATAWMGRAALLGHSDAAAEQAAGLESTEFARRALDLDRGTPTWGPLG